ncbi:type 2 isopentenyl-diphosphate Delta-isomerase [archaeon]|nr:type 2 isopentenyl-diphosphate Delta-isomerase [archaeon]
MVSTRKLDHINISLKRDVQSKIKNGFEDITFVHRALPEIDRDEIDTSCEFFGKKIGAPIFIAAMTGGHEKAKKINENLALAAAELNIPMGVGSQRAAIEEEGLAPTYSIVREAAPDIFLIGNVGAVQFAENYGIEEARKAVEMIDANALAVHLNPLQEAIMPEGDVDFKGALDGLKKLKDLSVPVIAKETGAGIAMEEAKLLEAAGAKGIDVGGLGGTSFSAVEYYRRKGFDETFWDWGIPTAVSTIECLAGTSLNIMSTGGIRNGLEVAKAVSLGAVSCGIAHPLLAEALKGKDEVRNALIKIIDELKTAMFLTGARTVEELKGVDLVITGTTNDWLSNRGIDTKKFARR